MASEHALKIESFTMQALPDDRTPSEGEILELASWVRKRFPVSDEEFDRTIKRIHELTQITMDEGTYIVGDQEHTPWVLARKPEIDPFYWHRYEQHLLKSGWSPQVTNTLDKVSEDILDLMGDPLNRKPWKRRGLVMGDVQSGKTATYTALCCKAADAKYRLIILLTGTLENLRRQTQERLDAGFVGLDSSGILTRHRQDRYVGVGLLDKRRNAAVLTSIKTDFKSDLINALGFKLDQFSEPILVVVKKNKRILENLENWLRSYNADSNGLIDAPMLLIDDEADNASVNTTASGSDPTAINRRIRSLLQLFRHSTYVGFTATPFANIFIDPETESEMVGDDIFPSDFIYSLEAPTNYMGADFWFDDRNLDDYVKEITDADEIFPDKHKSDLVVTGIPDSLKDAICTFVLANVIRDLRGDDTSHRSMLVNVTRFTAVQDQVANYIDLYLRNMQKAIRNYSQLESEHALRNFYMQRLYDVFGHQFSATGHSWQEIQANLPKGVLPITVRAVNQRSGAASLDYAENKKTGLRVIAVGGNSLSRGLTLEGLTVSYFYRNSQMYDTLMQMGRWFGYRDGYRDLCRLWMLPDAIQWYAHIAEATRELRKEIRRMRILDMTPREFGLKVRAHPDSLIVTARNKMRASKQIDRLISLSHQGIETPKVLANQEHIIANFSVINRFVAELSNRGMPQTESNSKYPMWRHVDKGIIINFLRQYQVHPLNMNFQPDGITEFLEQTSEPKLQYWDVVIPTGLEKEIYIESLKIKLQRRRVTMRNRTILVSGARARVGSRGVEKEGVDPEEVKAIEAAYRSAGKNPPDSEYRMHRQYPLLLIHLIKPFPIPEGLSSDEESLLESEVPLSALGLSFPPFGGAVGTENKMLVRYRVNMVWWNQLFEEEQDEAVEEDE